MKRETDHQHLARPWGARLVPFAHTRLTAVLLSPAADTFALCTPEQMEGHYSMYLSLFGRDLKVGNISRARTRLLIVEKMSDAKVVEAYTSYLKELGSK